MWHKSWLTKPEAELPRSGIPMFSNAIRVLNPHDGPFVEVTARFVNHSKIKGGRTMDMPIHRAIRRGF